MSLCQFCLIQIYVEMRENNAILVQTKPTQYFGNNSHNKLNDFLSLFMLCYVFRLFLNVLLLIFSEFKLWVNYSLQI